MLTQTLLTLFCLAVFPLCSTSLDDCFGPNIPRLALRFAPAVDTRFTRRTQVNVECYKDYKCNQVHVLLTNTTEKFYTEAWAAVAEKGNPSHFVGTFIKNKGYNRRCKAKAARHSRHKIRKGCINKLLAESEFVFDMRNYNLSQPLECVITLVQPPQTPSNSTEVPLPHYITDYRFPARELRELSTMSFMKSSASDIHR